MKKLWNDGVKLYHLSLWSARIVLALLIFTFIACYRNFFSLTVTVTLAILLTILSRVICAVHNRAWKLLSQDVRNRS